MTPRPVPTPRKQTGTPRVKTEPKEKKPRALTAYTRFCQRYLWTNGGGGRLKCAAEAWAQLSPETKAALGHRGSGAAIAERRRQKRERAMRAQLDLQPTATMALDSSPPGGVSPTSRPPVGGEAAAATRGAPAGQRVDQGIQCGEAARCVARDETRRPGVQFGEFAVVAGRRPRGRGGYGRVLEVRDSSGQSLAMKLFEEADSMSSEVAAYDAIARTVRQQRAAGRVRTVHDSFLQIIGQCADPPLAWMVLPLVQGPDLWTQLQQRRPVRSEVATILWDAYSALRFLHQAVGMMHLDVKPNNMMWHNGKLTLLDFSVWELWPVPAKRQLHSIYCTDGFRPPELTQLRRMSQQERRLVLCPAVDWWSLGCAVGCMAWAQSADPPLRRKMYLSAWGATEARDKDLDRVSPPGCPLRPVLELWLHVDAGKRSVEPRQLRNFILATIKMERQEANDDVE